MRHYLLVLLAALALTACALAQPQPNTPNANGQPGGQPGNRQGGGPGNGGFGNLAAPLLQILPEGIFVLENGVLARFDAATMKDAGTLELFDALPAQPVLPQNPTPQDRQAQRQWMRERFARSEPAAMLAQDGKLYIIIGTQYFVVNVKDMKREAKADLAPVAAAQNPNQNNRNQQAMQFTPPQMKLDAGTLYVVLGRELLSVNAADGKVLNRAALPAAMYPAPPDFGGMFGGRNGANNNANNNGGRQGGRGGRGGRGGNAAGGAQQ